jgi:hypothetical protein
LALERLELEPRSAQFQPVAVRCVPGAVTALPFQRPQEVVSEPWLAPAARLPRAGCPSAEPALWRVVGVCPHLPGVAVLETPLEPAVRPLPERLMAEPIAWCPRPAAVREAERPFAGQEARRSAQPEASAAPVGVLPPEESVVPSARPEAAAAAWRASAAEVARQPAAAVALRAQAGAAAERAWAAELPQGAAAAVRLWAAEGPEAAAEARA